MRNLILVVRPVAWVAVLAVLVASACSAPAVPAAAAAPVHQASPAEFVAEIGTRILVNVHTPDEGSIRGTDLTIPFDQILARAAELPADRATLLAIYCMTGRMSAIAGDTLTGLGYTDVVELRGGMRAWVADGRPLDPPRS